MVGAVMMISAKNILLRKQKTLDLRCLTAGPVHHALNPVLSYLLVPFFSPLGAVKNKRPPGKCPDFTFTYEFAILGGLKLYKV